MSSCLLVCVCSCTARLVSTFPRTLILGKDANSCEDAGCVQNAMDNGRVKLDQVHLEHTFS